jgi:hypothetical protein
LRKDGLQVIEGGKIRYGKKKCMPKLDSYAWRWVGYHMVKAGRQDDLRQLLLNFNYLQAKLIATNANALIADYEERSTIRAF